LYLRALPHHLSFDTARVVQALDLAYQAIDRDPGFGPALALAAWCHVQLETLGWADDLDDNRRRSLDLARRALHVAGDDPGVVGPAVFALARLDGGDLDAPIALIDRALELNPSFARGWSVSGWVRVYAGQPDL